MGFLDNSTDSLSNRPSFNRMHSAARLSAPDLLESPRRAGPFAAQLIVGIPGIRPTGSV